MSLTTDPRDPRLKRGADDVPVPQQEAYLVLPPEERAKGFLLPVRLTYQHTICGATTHMATPLAETFARDPWFYGGTFCVHCSRHRPLNEFTWWPDGSAMDPASWTEEQLQHVMRRKAETS